MTLDDTLAGIRSRDAALHYCATCGDRVYDPLDRSDPHSYTVAECDAYLKAASRKQGKVREPEGTGHLCWTPGDHHPFAEGTIPDYEAAERDRRTLLAMVSRDAAERIGRA